MRIPCVETKRVAGLAWKERAARRAAPKDRAIATIVNGVVVGVEIDWGWNEGAMDGGCVEEGGGDEKTREEEKELALTKRGPSFRRADTEHHHSDDIDVGCSAYRHFLIKYQLHL